MYKVVRRDLETDAGSPTLFYRLLADRPYSFLLESVIGGERVGRYSFIGADPLEAIRFVNGGELEWLNFDRHGESRRFRVDSLAGIRPALGQTSDLAAHSSDPLTGGWVGYIGYDAVRLIEDLPNAPRDSLNVPMGMLILPRILLAFDHLLQRISVFVYYSRGGRRAAERQADRVLAELRRPVKILAGQIPSVLRPAPCRSNMSRARFMGMVKKAKSYIRAGDIFQVVLSQQFRTPYAGDPLHLYRALRMLNPSPYMFMLKYPGFSLVGSSPEILVKLNGGRVCLRPIAGTRPRGKDEHEDAALEKELLADEKERAEHLMLVDLGRNDVGEVAEFGTVRTSDVFTIERYSAVMHIVSNVEGDLRAGKDALDVLSAAFPAGTVTGAPKVRALQIIDELEPSGRGPYAGAVGYFGAGGQMDFAITIRTLLVKNKMAYVQAGAGIVHDSNPKREFEETYNKARALLSAVTLAKHISRS